MVETEAEVLLKEAQVLGPGREVGTSGSILALADCRAGGVTLQLSLGFRSVKWLTIPIHPSHAPVLPSHSCPLPGPASFPFCSHVSSSSAAGHARPVS